MKTAEQVIKEHKEFAKKREAVKKLNDDLIDYWESIPWWKFWAYPPSFEERHTIIMSNWNQLIKEEHK